MKSIPLQSSDQRLVELFRALGHPARLRILQILAQRRACMCGEIVDQLPLSQATVSQHLKVLKQAGIIVGEVEGAAVCYCIAPGALDALSSAVGELHSRTCHEPACCDDHTC